MPVSNGIGESENTPIKNETVCALFSAWCAQVSKICERIARRVVVVDLTSGCGTQQDGSRTFIANARRIAASADLDIAICACDRSQDNLLALRQQTTIELPCCGEWQDYSDGIARLTQGAFAFIYHDPNSGYQKEHSDIIKLANDCPRADFCLHFDANQIKRIRCAGFAVHTLDELVQIRSHCLIRKPFGSGSQWTVMYLSQCAMNGYGKHGFYRLGDSETGTAMWERMYYTKRERMDRSGQRRLAFDY